MKTQLTIEASQSQKLLMNASLQQAIKILQMSQSELWTWVQDSVESNPFLQLQNQPDSMGSYDDETIRHLDEDWNAQSDYGGYYDDSELKNTLGWIPNPPVSLQVHLLNQLMSHNLSPQQFKIGEEIISWIDPSGYLEKPIITIAQSIQTSIPKVEKILQLIQKFDPIGIGARSLSECLRLQLIETGPISKSMNQFLDNLPLLEKMTLKEFSEKIQLNFSFCQEALKQIRMLNPKPGLQFDHQSPPEFRIPDLLVIRSNGKWNVHLNPHALPKVLIQTIPLSDLEKSASQKTTMSYIQSEKTKAQWLVHILEQRAQTLLRVGQAIINHQEDFFDKGIEKLKPLSLRTVADSLKIHESTVSRITTEKYIATPTQTYPLKFFFTHNPNKMKNLETISARTVLSRLENLVRNEPIQSPYSDDELTTLLIKEGIKLARRTVTKYRKSLKINSSIQRKQTYLLRNFSNSFDKSIGG